MDGTKQSQQSARMGREELDFARDGAEWYLFRGRPDDGIPGHTYPEGDVLYGQMRALRMAPQGTHVTERWVGWDVQLASDFLKLGTAAAVREFFAQDVSTFIARHLTFESTRWHKFMSEFPGSEVQTLFCRLEELAGYTPWDTASPGTGVSVLTDADTADDGTYRTFIISGPGGTVHVNIITSRCILPEDRLRGFFSTEGLTIDGLEYSRRMTLGELYGTQAPEMMRRMLTRNYAETLPRMPDCRHGTPEGWTATAELIICKTEDYRRELAELA